jgi:hypothetical protein
MYNEQYFDDIKKRVKSGYAMRMKAQGHSMAPLCINNRDEFVVSPCFPADIQVGDIVFAHAYLYNKGKRSVYPVYILHRVIKIQNSNPRMNGASNLLFILRGDGNCIGKEICDSKDIVGKVTLIIRYPHNHPNGVNIQCDSFAWWTYLTLWNLLFPFRRLLLYLRMKLNM